MKHEVKMLGYMVHLVTDGFYVAFSAYPVHDCTDANGNSGILYQCNDSSDVLPIFNAEKCLLKFEGTICWRGVWEGRIYFKDDEYWGEDLQEMANLYESCILPWCKNFVKETNQEYFKRVNDDA